MLRQCPPGVVVELYFTLMTIAYSNKAKATKTVHISSQRSIRVKVSDAGAFSLAFPDVLINIRSVVTKRDILPGSRSGGIRKLQKHT